MNDCKRDLPGCYIQLIAGVNIVYPSFMDELAVTSSLESYPSWLWGLGLDWPEQHVWLMSEASSNSTVMAREDRVGLLMCQQNGESDPTAFVSCGNIYFGTEPLWKIF